MTLWLSHGAQGAARGRQSTRPEWATGLRWGSHPQAGASVIKMNFYRLHADFFGRMQYNKICQKNMIPQKVQKVQKA